MVIDFRAERHRECRRQFTASGAYSEAMALLDHVQDARDEWAAPDISGPEIDALRAAVLSAYT